MLKLAIWFSLNKFVNFWVWNQLTRNTDSCRNTTSFVDFCDFPHINKELFRVVRQIPDLLVTCDLNCRHILDWTVWDEACLTNEPTGEFFFGLLLPPNVMERTKVCVKLRTETATCLLVSFLKFSHYQQNSKVMVMQRLNTSMKIQLTLWFSRETKLSEDKFTAQTSSNWSFTRKHKNFMLKMTTNNLFHT